ncbi:MAG: choice-of-anchor Q domain-containing protein, partial [Planctomycetota bacterium]
MLRMRVVTGLVVLLAASATSEAAELAVNSITIGPGQTDAVVVSGDVDVPCFGVTLMVVISPQGGNTGTSEFTPGPADIVQLGHPWSTQGAIILFDADDIGFPTENFYSDSNTSFLNEPVTFSGPLASFPVVASSDASGVWDVFLSSVNLALDSTWDATPTISTTRISGTITVSPFSSERHVDVIAPAGGDGLSWPTAYNNLQDALVDAAGSGGTVTEIRVAAGTYTPAGPGGARTATFQLINGVALSGGYAGTGQPDPDERDIALHKTILSGDLNGDDNSGGDNSENSYHVVTGSGTDATAVLDGVTISGGNADGPGEPDFHDRGGGMYNDAGSPTVSQCAFTENSCLFFGGGMYNNAGSNATLINCAFITNSAQFGGGVRSIASNPTMTNCTFWGNTASTFGGGVSNSATSFPALVNCVLWGNSAGFGTDEEEQINGGFISINYSCVQGWTGAMGGAGNIGDDPLLVGGSDVHLQAGSPCVNSGDNSATNLPLADVDGDSRVQHCRVDMGVDETPHFADCNTNGTADACDLD